MSQEEISTVLNPTPGTEEEKLESNNNNNSEITTTGGIMSDEDKDIEDLKKQVEIMQQEALKLENMQKEAVQNMLQPPVMYELSSSAQGVAGNNNVATNGAAAMPVMGYSSQMDNGSTPQSKSVDVRSIYIGNVDYSSTPEELQTLFQSCGMINRVTILCDKFTGHPKGYAYIEFSDEESVNNAMSLDGSFFHQRQIKVNPKRTNVPGVSVGPAAGGGGGRGRGRGRGSIPAGGRGYPRAPVQPYYYQPYPYAYY